MLQRVDSPETEAMGRVSSAAPTVIRMTNAATRIVEIPSSRRGRRRSSLSWTEDGTSLRRGIRIMLSSGRGPRSVANLFGSVPRPRDLPFEGGVFAQVGEIGFQPGFQPGFQLGWFG